MAEPAPSDAFRNLADEPAHPDELVVRSARILERSWRPRNLTRGVFLGGSIAAILFRSPSLALVAVLALIALVRSWLDRPQLVGTSGVRLSANREGLFSNGLQLVARHEIVSGLVSPVTRHGPVVRLARRRLRPPIEIAVSSLEEARGLVGAMGLDARHMRVAMTLPSPLRGRKRSKWPLLFVSALLSASMWLGERSGLQFLGYVAIASVLALVVGALALFVASLLPSIVTLGTDAIRLRFGLRVREIPYADITRVDETARGLRIQRRSGSPLDIVTDRLEMRVLASAADGHLRVHDVLLERLHEAMAGEKADAELVASLDPNGRDARAWRESLRAMMARAEGFRDVPVRADALLRMVENPLVPQAIRGAAAAALTSVSEPLVRDRLRVAADSVVSPPLRVALTAAATEDEAALEEALGELQRVAVVEKHS